MKETMYRATETRRNSFGQTITQDLEFNKKEIAITFEEIKNVPDGIYGALATEELRKLVKFEAWEDPEDCKFLDVEVQDGKIVNAKDVDVEVYRSNINFLRIQ